MITDIPTPEEFREAGLNQIYLAWQIALTTVSDFDEVTSYNPDPDDEAIATYWKRSQPALANAFNLVQQGMEMALKGLIAQISPYLLIARDPKEWPGGTASTDTSFSAFRTLDAADLIKVYNSVAPTRLDTAFIEFWEQVRQDRNRLMHSIAPKTFDPALLVRTILTAVETLFNDVRWPLRLLDMVAEGKLAALGYVDDTQNIAMAQIAGALRHLSPSEAKRFFGFDKRRRAYVCPQCHYAANTDWQDDWPALAQFPSRGSGQTILRCILCECESEVERRRCQGDDCKGDVMVDDRCLTCMRTYREKLDFHSELVDMSLGNEHRYELTFGRGCYGRGGTFADVEQCFASAEEACEHARRALCDPKYAEWDSVMVRPVGPLGGSFSLLLGKPEPVGFWRRRGDALDWHPDQNIMAIDLAQPTASPGATDAS